MCERQRRNTSRVSCLSELRSVARSFIRSTLARTTQDMRGMIKKKNFHSGIVDRIHLHSSHSKSDNNVKILI